jgi:hypothetical protein
MGDPRSRAMEREYRELATDLEAEVIVAALSQCTGTAQP